MLNALSQSPITAQQFFEWNEKLQNDEILVREIIDIDTNYMEDEKPVYLQNKKDEEEEKKMMRKNEDNSDEEDEFNPTLAAMESEIKPKVLKTVNNLTKEYSKLIKYQKERLDCIVNSKSFSTSKEKNYKKIVRKYFRKYKISTVITISFRRTCPKTSQ